MPHSELVGLRSGDVIYSEYVEQTSVYFPTDGVVSFLHAMANGDTAEVGLVGFDGLVGIAPVLGGYAASGRAVVQADGAALRLPAQILRAQVLTDPDLGALLAQYAQAFFAQVAQTAACNMHHSVMERLCRWTLLMIDRLQVNEFRMTQTQMSDMVGNDRSRVNGAATELKALGIWDYTRGHVTVLDRAKLENTACECYRALNVDIERLLRIR